MYMYGARFRAQPFLSKMRALEIGRAKRKSNDGKIKKTDRQYVTNETSRYKSHFVYNIWWQRKAFRCHLCIKSNLQTKQPTLDYHG